MAGKGGGAWKVAYADFVTAMMAFFLVMWIVAQSKPVKESIAQYFRNPTGYGNRPGTMSSPLLLKDGGTSPIDKGPYNQSKLRPAVPSDDAAEERTGTKTARITMGPDDNLTIGTQVPFAEDSAELDEAGRKVLDRIIPELLGKICKIELRGHASGRRMPAGSTYKDAWELSYARSVAVKNYLAEKGIDPRRIRLSQSGSNDPNLSTDGLGRGIQNSRVEVYVLNEVITTPSEFDKRRPGGKKGGPKKPPQPKMTPREPSAPEAPADLEEATDKTPGANAH